MWKKEIKLSSLFRRRRQQTQPRPQLALPAPGDTLAEAPTGPVASHPYPSQPAPAPPVVPRPPRPGGRRRAARRAEPRAGRRARAGASCRCSPLLPAAVAAAAVGPAPKQPFWKKELGRRTGEESKRSAPERRERQEQPKAGRPAPERRPKGSAQLPQVPLMKALNLLPQDIKLPKTTVRPWVAYAAVGAVALLVAGGMGFLYLNESQHIADRESTLEDMEAQLAALEAEAVRRRPTAPTAPPSRARPSRGPPRCPSPSTVVAAGIVCCGSCR